MGHVADIAVLEAESGVFAFKDSWPAKRLGTKRLENVLTVRAGKIVYERNPRPPAVQDTTIYDLLIKQGRSEITRGKWTWGLSAIAWRALGRTLKQRTRGWWLRPKVTVNARDDRGRRRRRL